MFFADPDQQRVKFVEQFRVRWQTALEKILDLLIVRSLLDKFAPAEHPGRIGIDNEDRFIERIKHNRIRRLRPYPVHSQELFPQAGRIEIFENPQVAVERQPLIIRGRRGRLSQIVLIQLTGKRLVVGGHSPIDQAEESVVKAAGRMIDTVVRSLDGGMAKTLGKTFARTVADIEPVLR